MIEPKSPALQANSLPAEPLGKQDLFILFTYFLAMLCLCCCMRAFSSCGKQELLFVAVPGLLIAAASLVAEHKF